LFPGVSQRLAARKRWIAFNLDASGMIIVDDGARDAILNKGKSLLAVGIRAVSGEFQTGDAVLIAGLDGTPFARALVNYSSTELNVVKGMKRPAMIDALGGNVYDCVAHRDNLALIDRAPDSARAPLMNGRKPQL
jgi:glutamate 5-kinase